MPVRTRKHWTHLAKVALQQRDDSFRYCGLESSARFRLRPVEDHTPFLAHLPEMRADPDERERTLAYRPDGEERDHQPIPIGDKVRDLSLRAGGVPHQLLAHGNQAWSGNDPRGLGTRLARALKPGNQLRQDLRNLPREHDPDGVAQMREIGMSPDCAGGLGEMFEIMR
jgi:hypothetical protein